MRAGNILLLGTQRKAHVLTRRHGLVRGVGQQWVDDDGPWYPLGGTLFWALRGFRYEPARLKLNQLFLTAHGCDYQRILGHVDWPGNDIDWRWAITEEVLGRFLDYSFYELGLRTSVSLLGSRLPGSSMDEMALRFAAIVDQRSETVLDVDCANEAAVNHIDLELLERMATLLRGVGLPHILALTDVEHSGVEWDAVRHGALVVGGANSLCSHPDRGQSDDGCRFIRQPYDFKDLTYTVHCEEPIGPLSSVAQSMDPLQLALLRAVAITHGEGAFIIHNGAGVFGQPDPAHNRPPNLWEVPGIVPIMQAIRNVAAILPPDAGHGSHHNNDAGNPCRVTTIWPDVASGANRRYTVEYPWGFVCPSFGIVTPKDQYGRVIGGVTYACPRACRIEVFDPVLNEVIQHQTVTAGGTFDVHPISLDHAGHGGVIIRGAFL